MNIPMFLKPKTIYIEDFIEEGPVLYMGDAKEVFKINVGYWQRYYDFETTEERFGQIVFDKDLNIKNIEIWGSSSSNENKKKVYNILLQSLDKQGGKLLFRNEEYKKTLLKKMKEYTYYATQIF